MSEVLKPDLCVIGAGSAGLSVAAGAVQMGASVVLIEKGKMGGDCLNTGCVPSKSLLAAAHRAASARASHTLGVALSANVDFIAVQRHVQSVIEDIAPHDSVERFEGLGVKVIKAEAKFIDATKLQAGSHTIIPRRYVIASGSHPAVPPLPGLASAPYLTNETIFNLTILPSHLIVLGGGPIGCELAQAFRALGSQVTLIEMARLLPKDDPQLVDVLRRRLIDDGVLLHEAAAATAVSNKNNSIEVACKAGDKEFVVSGSQLLVAVGRRPSLEGLNLAAANIAATAKGVTVDARLRTTNPKAFAIGDCCGGPQFTHVAGYHAGIVVRQALFRLPAKADHTTIPWVTYTSPELAQVGLTEAEARAKFGDDVRVLTAAFAENDRARTEGDTGGLLKAIVTPRGKILGAGIAGSHAGELIQPWVLAISQGLKVGALATMVAPYPTLGEVTKRAAGSFYTPTLFGARTKALVRFLRLFD
ncbi:MAG: dihydrolipoamide dehydrogenase [Rhodospirillaceae bacterium]|nr:dihydrolipoamide dehydrogenase [Rhodospirillaceae bacterium]